MDLSPQEITHIKDEVESLVRSLHAAHLARGEGSLEHFLSFFDDDVIGIGTGKDEMVFNKEDLLTLLEREWSETPDALHYALHSVDVRVLSAESASAQSFIDIFFGEPGGDSLYARLTTVFRKVDGQWKSAHWHASVPWEVQPEGVSWPVDELKARARKLEQEVAARTEELSRANRELEVEAALERIRGRALAMRTSAELDDVAGEIRHQMGLLGQKDLEVCIIHIYDTGEDWWETWGAVPDPENPGQIVRAPARRLPKKGLTIIEEAIAAYESDENDHVFINRGEKAANFFAGMKKYAPEHFEALSKLVEMAGVSMEEVSAYWTFSDFSGGSIGMVTYQPADPDSRDLLRRTAKVFELAYRRFQDLREAEAAAREAQIEAALERVRAQALGMRTSDELLEVVATIHRQFSGLGLECGVFWHAHYHPDHYEKALTSVDGSKVTTLMILPRDFSAVPELATWERGTEPFAVFQFNADQGARYMEHMINKGHFLVVDPNGVGPDDVRANGGLTFVQARTSSGEIGYSLWGEAEPEPEAKDVLLRFARVFDLAYRRYRDLQEAEEASQEARIEMSLERVRAQAMAMQKPEDISQVSIRMFDELEGLGVQSLRSGISIPGEGGRYVFHAATKDESGATTLVLGDESVDVHRIIRRAYDGWKEQEPFQHTVLAGKDLVEYYHAVFDTMPLPDWKERMQRGAAASESFATFPFQDGWLYAFARHEMGDSELDLYQRFARVFGLAYQRYHDLKKAEAQARESQIEAALERVRSKAMGMQKPEDIGITCHAMFEEIRGLCPEVLRFGLGVATDDQHFEPWMVGKDPDGHPRIFRGRSLPEGERDEIDDLFTVWREKRAHWFKESRDFLEWANTIYLNAVTQGVIPVDSDRDQYFSAFTHQTGFLYVIAHDPYGLEREEGRIINRFGGVFDLAYQRYNDLKQAEIDYQALLAEKARTEQALSDLQATQQQLIEQEKLASLGSLTAGIAHEIKNPLNFVNNFAEVSTELMEELAEAVARGDTEEAAAILDDLRDNATQIAKHGKRADSIVRSMMQHARGGASDRETIKVNDFLEEYANLAWHGMRARDHGFQADVVRDFDEAAGSLIVMPQELGRVVLNLLNNAFDAVKGQGDAVVTVGSRRSEAGITITVSDNGPGVPEAVRPKIFEPFFTTKATGEGTGLGLSLSYDIVTKGHGGTMTVGESPDGGALFTITLPSSYE